MPDAQRLLDPKILARLSTIELVAKTVVEGFVAGLHRSPTFGFSQEFAEYRPYVQGDDPRFVDWNVYARTDRTYLKRYLGETNTALVLLFDASNSMGYRSTGVSKIEYARFLAASLAYLALHQHDAVSLILFDEKVRRYIPPSTRPGQLHGVLHAIEHAEPATRTNIQQPFEHFQQFLTKRGLVAVISDFYEQPERIIKAVRPLCYHGNDMMLFHILDPAELSPPLRDSALLEDMETGERMEVAPEYARGEYRKLIQSHIDNLRREAQGAGADYLLLDTSKPLDLALKEFLQFRYKRM
ncbi:MAG TPA: DUF58 domain-containing protein [Bryobacterales bacterium]|jgi:uncharacterized protein (DUF58 family)|nr:DUF58 domain-containing protein [Bryobacterales bacterium]